MPDITTRGTNGIALTHQQMDENFAEVQHAAVTSNPPINSTVNREHLVITSGTITVTLPDAATLASTLAETDTGAEDIGFWFKLTNNSGNTATVNLTTAGDTLNGITKAAGGTYSLVDNASIIVQLDSKSGTVGYNIIGEYVPKRTKSILFGQVAFITYINNIYTWFGADTIASSDRTVVECGMPTSGIIRNLYVEVGTNSIDDTTVFTFYKGAAAQSVTVSYGDSVTGAQSDTSNSFSFSAGEKISLNINPTTGTPTAGIMTQIRYSFEIITDDS